MSLSNPLTRVGLSLFAKLCKDGPGDDVLLSPLSIAACLSMAAAGATEGSETEKAFQELLGSSGPFVPPGDTGLDMALSAWLKGDIQKDYIDSIKAVFGADALPLKSVNPEPINAWVKEKTKGRISKLFDDLDPLTVLVLVNTVFFKGSWMNKFDASGTAEAVFNTFKGESVPCNLMYKTDKKMMYAEDETVQAVRLLYDKGDLSATILLPRAEGPEALDKLIASLTPASWAKWNRDLQERKKKVDLYLPRFKLECGGEFTGPLKSLGLGSAFSGSGQFLRMSQDPEVHISSVMHKATVEVNEEGTVAAAATGAVMASRGLSLDKPTIMRVDRPFLFLITTSDGTVMFLGRALRPTLSGIAATFDSAATPSVETMLGIIFGMIDYDKSGFISIDEIVKLQNSLSAKQGGDYSDDDAKKLFLAMDANLDGKVSPKEWNDFFKRSMTGRSSQQQLSQLHEMKAKIAAAAFVSEDKNPSKFEQAVKALFNIEDADKSGFIDFLEFKTLRKAIFDRDGKAFSEEDAKSCFELADTDKDGKITLDEYMASFKTYMSQWPEDQRVFVLNHMNEVCSQAAKRRRLA